MRSSAVFSWMGLGFLSALGLVGCGESEEPAFPEPAASTPAPAFPSESGQPAPLAAPYPEGGYGIQEGAVIENFQFIGFANALKSKDGLQVIALSDFYNPTGDETFPEGSLYGAGQPKPKALLVNIGSVWCGPCNEEARTMLPTKYAEYKPQGGEFLSQLADGPNSSFAATVKDLERWTTRYEVDYPSTIDPTYKLGKLFEQDAFPANMIVRTKDMRIIMVVPGTPDSVFWSTFEDVLAGNP